MKLLSLSSTIVLLAGVLAVSPAAAQETGASGPEARLDALLDGQVTARAQQRAARGDAVPVIIVVDDAVLPASGVTLPTEFELEQRGAGLDALRDRILARAQRATGRRFSRADAQIDAGAGSERVYQTYSLLPAFAMTARPDTLAALRAQPEVRAVYQDIAVPPVLDESTRIVGADVVWSEGFAGVDVSVAVLDSGVELEHSMTGPAITASACFNTNVPGVASSLCPGGDEEVLQLDGGEAGDSCVEDDISTPPEDGVDGCFHGTHVAGIAAGRPVTLSAGAELSGIARLADIVAVNVFSRIVAEECEEDGAAEADCIRSYDTDQLAALEWLYANRDTLNLASVNMSLGSGEVSNACNGDLLRTMIASLRAAGIATAISSGNDRYLDAVGSPSCIPEAITVGSTTKDDEVSGFSNSAELVDLLAPGSSIVSAWQSEEPAEGETCIIQDAEPNDEGFCHWYITASGTSMAAPHVAGAFALLRDAFPNVTVDEMEAALKFSGVQITDPDNGITRSRIQVDAAYDILAEGGAFVEGVEVTPVEPYRVSGESGDQDSFATKSYVLRNTTGASRTVSVDSRPSWVSVNNTAFTIPAGGQRTLTLGVDTSGLPTGIADSGTVTLTYNSSNSLDIPVSIMVERSTAAADFGPFEWSGDQSNPSWDGLTTSIFRITGLDGGAPVAIRVAIDSPAWGSSNDDFDDCSLTIRPARYSGSEYLVSAGDLLDCGGFERADLRFRVEVDGEDAASGLRMRRFVTNASGGISDFSFDAEGVSVADASTAAAGADMNSLVHGFSDGGLWDVAAGSSGNGDADEPAATAQAEFGPFEWTGDANASTGNLFRITGLDSADPTAIDVAIANASSGSYAGTYADCSMTVGSTGGTSEYTFTQDNLADCGDFGRADLSFRVTADSADVANGLTMRRIATTTGGGLTDFSFDLENSTPAPLTPIDATRGRVVFGPFEWAGDRTAPTSNVFRIVGFEGGAPLNIAVAIHSALRGGFQGKFSDCALTIRPGRHNGSEYLITQSDLADCGDFGRGDLTFRIRADLADVPDGLIMRRFAVGADGDLTDFRFDHTAGSNARNVALPDGASPGMAAVEFGPFEWTGEASASTRSIFRISGLDTGAPERIDVALGSAASGDFNGVYEDCSLTIRAVRSGNSEFIIGSQDLADCGAFGRADVSFRVVADQSDVDGGLTMRRFAVTSGGGLTDFGFDAEASGN